MTGVILCGGQSTRMQEDKGLLLSGQQTWAAKMAELLRPLCTTLVLSVNPHQVAYHTQMAEYPLMEDDTSLNISGPLLGLMTVHRHYPESDLFLLACDMQLMQTEVLEAMAKQYRESPLYDAWIFRGQEGFSEPLAGIYSAKALAGILEQHYVNPLQRHSMKLLLSRLKVCYYPIPRKWETCFTNFNSPGDLTRNLP